ncbi:hypothetical protein FIBSPDRAFT_685017, partial [Athelia psychrophila]
AATALSFLAGARAQLESHQVTFVNNCGYGTPLFSYQLNNTAQGATTISGEVNGGIAWLGDQGGCEASGVNCTAVEFALQNTGYSQAIINLIHTEGHVYTYPIAFNFTGGCSNGLVCDSSTCPDAAYNSAQLLPMPQQCAADNCGV